MSLKEYNLLQKKYFEVCDVNTSNIIQFSKMCASIAYIRDCQVSADCENTVKCILDIFLEKFI